MSGQWRVREQESTEEGSVVVRWRNARMSCQSELRQTGGKRHFCGQACFSHLGLLCTKPDSTVWLSFSLCLSLQWTCHPSSVLSIYLDSLFGKESKTIHWNETFSLTQELQCPNALEIFIDYWLFDGQFGYDFNFIWSGKCKQRIQCSLPFVCTISVLSTV